MIEKLFTGLLALTRGIARLFGYELSVRLTEHQINLAFRDPDDRESRAWDPDAFVRGCVFVGDYANAVTVDTDELGLEPTERYSDFMKANFTSDIVEAESGRLTRVQLLLAIGALQVTTAVVLVVV